jgi:hypothetical protein
LIEEGSMKNLMIVLVLVVVGVVALGFYRGWFHLTSEGGNDKIHVDLTVDGDKIHMDKDQAQEKVRDLGNQVRGKVAPTEKSSGRTTAPAPPPPNRE